MYLALYRKWRSKTFDDIVGQEHITTALKNQVSQGRPSHAYLFCGTRGTGKTSCSKILAKAVNCESSQNGNPCCECDNCRGIDSDRLLDVTEIDAASNSGVDNIRELREEAGFTPVSLTYRVYIIDEAHMLSTGAFNALLKIMEEPPAHVLFILATTEIHKVPATIMSRCQRFDFRRIPGDVIAGHLLYIAKEEKILLDESAALMIARLSDGGMRDAVSLLDLCLSGGDEITADTVRECAGLADRNYLFDIQGAAIEGNAPEALEILNFLWEKSIDYQRLCDQLLDAYRNLMVAKSAQNPVELIACLPDELERYRELAAKCPMERIFYSMSILEDTQMRMSRTSQRRAELEMGLLKLCDTALSDTPQALLARIERLEAALKSRPVPGAVTPPPDGGDSPQGSGRVAAEPAAVITEPGIPVEEFPEWAAVLEYLAKKNRALHGTLVNSKAYTAVGGLLLVDAGDGLFAQMVRSDEYARKSLREAAFEITGKKFRLGPYQPEKYEIKPAAKMDALEDAAKDLGIEIQIL